jgi:hypothetical protein
LICNVCDVAMNHSALFADVVSPICCALIVMK